MFAIWVAYTQNDGEINRVKQCLNASGVQKLPQGGILIPNAIRFDAPGGGRLYAVAGTTNLAQWFSYLVPADARAVAGCAGKVYGVLADIADQGYAVIANDARTAANRGLPITIIGHSLGGACAEIWANKLVRLEGFSNVAVTSYGGPRFGDDGYVAEPAPFIDRQRVVTFGDPCPNVLPTLFATGISPLSGPIKVTTACRYLHYADRVTVLTANDYDRVHQEDGPLSAMLYDLAKLTVGAHGLFTRHLTATYGAWAFYNSLLAKGNPENSAWKTAAIQLAHDLFGV